MRYIDNDFTLDENIEAVLAEIRIALNNYIEKELKEDPDYDFRTDENLAVVLMSMCKLAYHIEDEWKIEFIYKEDDNHER